MKPQIHKLNETIIALREKTSTYFSVTRLTSIKSLCKEPIIAAQFVFHLARLTFEKVQNSSCPKYIEVTDWRFYQALITEAVSLMERYLRTPTEENISSLHEIRRRVTSVQSYTGKKIWGHSIRTIHSRDVLVIEDALQCLMSPEVAPFWAYQTARDYAEQYNPHYGTGLVPESVPMLEDIASFWSNQS